MNNTDTTIAKSACKLTVLKFSLIEIGFENQFTTCYHNCTLGDVIIKSHYHPFHEILSFS